MTNATETSPPRNPWIRRSNIILIIVALLLVVGAVGHGISKKSPAAKAAQATATWSPSTPKFCAALISLNQHSGQKTPSPELTAIETLSVVSPTSALHHLFSSMAQDYANLQSDPRGLTAVRKSSYTGTTDKLRNSADPKVAQFAKDDYALVNDPRFINSVSNAVTSCVPAVTATARKTALAAVNAAYYSAVAANGPFPITSAAVHKDLPTGTDATVLSNRNSSGVRDFIFLFVNGPTLCVSSPAAPTSSAASVPAPTTVSCQ
jgi:hypothetical protein